MEKMDSEALGIRIESQLSLQNERVIAADCFNARSETHMLGWICFFFSFFFCGPLIKASSPTINRVFIHACVFGGHRESRKGCSQVTFLSKQPFRLFRIIFNCKILLRSSGKNWSPQNYVCGLRDDVGIWEICTAHFTILQNLDNVVTKRIEILRRFSLSKFPGLIHESFVTFLHFSRAAVPKKGASYMAAASNDASRYESGHEVSSFSKSINWSTQGSRIKQIPSLSVTLRSFLGI